MVKLLYITANPKGLEQSKGLQIGEAFLDGFLLSRPDTQVSRLDLFQLDIPEMDAELISARGKTAGSGLSLEQLTKPERSKLLRMHAVADHFLDFDCYVFVSPVWNLGSPPVLKAYLDNLFVHGKTFAFTSDGPKGLLAGKTAIHIQTRGGIYSEGPMKGLESGDRYLQIALGFLGIRMMPTVVAEGFDRFPHQTDQIVASAKVKAAVAAAKIAQDSEGLCPAEECSHV
ncbi:NAD(P)H-dependent oxidoreductase [Mesobacillus foraminis]|uniref:FMN-dependent NADH-azoreductase n=1 Tax=Mesobacillus foraminis TaxID=279826 RepID=UPI0039A13668